MTKNSISYKELYDFIDGRFNRFEAKLDERFETIDRRIDKVHERINPLEQSVHKMWVYMGIAIAFVTGVAQIVVVWIKKQLGLF